MAESKLQSNDANGNHHGGWIRHASTLHGIQPRAQAWGFLGGQELVDPVSPLRSDGKLLTDKQKLAAYTPARLSLPSVSYPKNQRQLWVKRAARKVGLTSSFTFYTAGGEYS